MKPNFPVLRAVSPAVTLFACMTLAPSARSQTASVATTVVKLEETVETQSSPDYSLGAKRRLKATVPASQTAGNSNTVWVPLGYFEPGKHRLSVSCTGHSANSSATMDFSVIYGSPLVVDQISQTSVQSSFKFYATTHAGNPGQYLFLKYTNTAPPDNPNVVHVTMESDGPSNWHGATVTDSAVLAVMLPLQAKIENSLVANIYSDVRINAPFYVQGNTVLTTANLTTFLPTSLVASGISRASGPSSSEISFNDTRNSARMLVLKSGVAQPVNAATSSFEVRHPGLGAGDEPMLKVTGNAAGAGSALITVPATFTKDTTFNGTVTIPGTANITKVPAKGGISMDGFGTP